MPRAKVRTPELRDRILDVAVSLLADEGVTGFTARGVARLAATSPPAVYELFGDRGGLLREVFFEGFRQLHRRLTSLDETDDPRADLVALCFAYRDFMRDNPVLASLMFSRPFSDFDPGPAEVEAGASVRTLIVGRVRRCTRAYAWLGDNTDIAHVLVCLVQGLAAAENARRLGTSRASVDRRWALAIDALLDGLVD